MNNETKSESKNETKSDSKSVPLAKRNHREVTSFLGHEMLFDYISGDLDAERKKAIDDFLKSSKDAQLDLIKIMNGLKYSEQLAETVVSQELLEKVLEPETYLSVLLKKSKFDQWPISVKWSIEALIVVTGIVFLLMLVPWDKALKMDFVPTSQEVILAEVQKQNKIVGVTGKEIENQETPQFVDEPTTKVPPSAANAKANTKANVKASSASKAQPVPPIAAVHPPAPSIPSLPAETPKQVLAVVKTETSSSKIEKPVPATNAPSSGPATTGFLFRGVLKVTNAAAISPKITDKIIELGGRKAGEVDLGWKKTESAYYYHFTLPEAKYEELNRFLSEYSTTQISKEIHPRVMPDGIVRLIIQVEEKHP